jgi:hypothetical protein
MMENILKPITDTDMDSLFILPLSLIPLETASLQTARVVKNVRLKSVIELFHDEQTGSGQLDVEQLPNMLGWPLDQVHPDLSILRRLSLLPSYDIYSLRISLRAHKIPVSDFSALRLSPEKAEELTKYMVMFTRPLMALIYGDNAVQVSSYDGLLSLFRDPDVSKARERLEKFASSLNISIFEVPKFLEDYGDTFMALSFFRYCLDRLEPYFSACLEALRPIRKHFQLMQDANLMKTCAIVEDSINSVSASITGRLETFEKRTQQMWGNISQKEFNAVRELIERYHVTIGGSLCGLTVKMNAFARLFPHAQAGGPVKRADFMISEMIQGIDMIRDMEKRYQDRG